MYVNMPYKIYIYMSYDLLRELVELLVQEAAFNTGLLKKMGYKHIGAAKKRIGSDTFIHSKDDNSPEYHNSLTKTVNANLDKGGYYRSAKHDTLKDPPAVGISLPKHMKG